MMELTDQLFRELSALDQVEALALGGSRAGERFDVPYPPRLRENIMENSWRLLHSSMPAYEGQIKKALKRGGPGERQPPDSRLSGGLF